MPELGPLGETFFEASDRAMVEASLVNRPFGGWVESVLTFATQRFPPFCPRPLDDDDFADPFSPDLCTTMINFSACKMPACEMPMTEWKFICRNWRAGQELEAEVGSQGGNRQALEFLI